MSSEASEFLISTGIRKLDEILGGGFSVPGLVEIWGGPGTGKTLFAHLITAVNIRTHTIFWLDTERTFRIELLKRWIPADNLRNLKYALVPTLDTLLYYLEKIQNYESQNILIIVDTLTGLARSELPNLPQRNRMIMAILRRLKSIAAIKQAIVLLTNQIISNLVSDIPAGGNLLRQQVKYALGFKKSEDTLGISIDSTSFFAKYIKQIQINFSQLLGVEQAWV